MQITSLRVGYLVHAYRQAPWRIQRQWMGAFLLGVLGIAMVSSLYLDVTAQAAIAGREIQGLTIDIVSIQQGNADLQRCPDPRCPARKAGVVDAGARAVPRNEADGRQTCRRGMPCFSHRTQTEDFLTTDFRKRYKQIRM